jgi:ABC-type multidrug transport system fused ATPase/permease subunit
MRRIVAGLILAVLLAACSADQTQTASPEMAQDAVGGYAARADMDVAAEEAAAPAPAAPPPPGQPASQPTGPAPTLYLAYSYAMGFEVPSERLDPLMAAHVQTCVDAGPRLCQLINSSRSGDPQSFMQGNLSLRGEPNWLRTFMAGMETQVDDAGGRITSQSTGTEDLTRAIVDTEARLRALTSLRDRLQDLLRSRPGRLADLLEVERELARVQGEIDSIQSNLAVMRTRVAMSELNLNYQSSPRPLGSDTFQPLREAFASFLGIIVGVFAAMITIVAALIPIVIVVVPLVWLALRWRKKRGGRFFRRSPPPAPPAAAS